MVNVLLDQVSKKYEEAWAVRDVSLRVEHGEAIVLLGPTGSGKTTVLRLIAGLEQPTRGDILFDGKPPHQDLDKRNISMLFAETRLYPKMTVRSNIGFPLSVRKVPEPEKSHRIEAEARALGIDRLLERMPATLSAGQSDLVDLAKAMVRAPGLFLVDEPLESVDTKARRLVRRELRDIQQGYGATAIYATHDQEDAMVLGDRLVIVEEGTIRQIGTPAEIYHEPDDTFVATFLGSPEMSLLSGRRTAGGVEIDGLTLTAPKDLPSDVLVGVRPERWTESNTGLTGNVAGIDDLGTDVFVTLETDSGGLIMRWRDEPPALGVEVTVSPDAYHLFDPQTGHVLHHS